MTSDQLSALLADLLRLPNETEWVEFKENVTDPDMIAKRMSGLPTPLPWRAVPPAIWVGVSRTAPTP